MKYQLHDSEIDSFILEKDSIILSFPNGFYAEDDNGNEIILETLHTDDIFGTNISSTGNDNCDIIAKENTEVLVIDYVKLMNPKNLRYPYFNTFADHYCQRLCDYLSAFKSVLYSDVWYPWCRIILYEQGIRRV